MTADDRKKPNTESQWHTLRIEIARKALVGRLFCHHDKNAIVLTTAVFLRLVVSHRQRRGAMKNLKLA